MFKPTGTLVLRGTNGARFEFDPSSSGLSADKIAALEKIVSTGSADVLTREESALLSTERAVVKGEKGGDFGFVRFDVKFFKID